MTRPDIDAIEKRLNDDLAGCSPEFSNMEGLCVYEGQGYTSQEYLTVGELRAMIAELRELRAQVAEYK